MNMFLLCCAILGSPIFWTDKFILLITAFVSLRYFFFFLFLLLFFYFFHLLSSDFFLVLLYPSFSFFSNRWINEQNILLGKVKLKIQRKENINFLFDISCLCFCWSIIFFDSLIHIHIDPWSRPSHWFTFWSQLVFYLLFSIQRTSDDALYLYKKKFILSFDSFFLFYFLSSISFSFDQLSIVPWFVPIDLNTIFFL